MKCSRFFVFLFIYVAQIFAQTEQLQVSLTPHSEVPSEAELNLSVNLNVNPEAGIFIELPDGLSVTPLAIKINGDSFWLLNQMKRPEKDSTIAWQSVDGGMMLLFANGKPGIGNSLDMKFITGSRKRPSTENLIKIKNITYQSNRFSITEQVMASGEIPSSVNR